MIGKNIIVALAMFMVVGAVSAQYYTDGVPVNMDTAILVDDTVFVDDVDDDIVACAVNDDDEEECILVEEVRDPWGDIDYKITKMQDGDVNTAEVERWHEIDKYLPDGEIRYYRDSVPVDEIVAGDALDLEQATNIQVYHPPMYPAYDEPVIIATMANGDEFPVIVEDYEVEDFAGIKIVDDSLMYDKPMMLMAIN